MAIDYGSLFLGPSVDTVTDPQQLFQALPSKAKKYAYLRDVQGDVLGKWVASPRQQDTVIKMNTGGGKTTVGLLLLKCSMNEGLGPAVYVAPDKYLCTQVEREAAELGLSFTNDPRSADFQASRSILIIHVQVLINGFSKFGVGRNLEIGIGTLLIDDAHACLAVAEEQFSLKISRSEAAFDQMFALFEQDLATQSPVLAHELKTGSAKELVPVPFWAWRDKLDSVIKILSSQLSAENARYVWPLLKNDIQCFSCFFDSSGIEISSRCLPIDAIPSFEQANRRIYMTATLADDSILVSDFGVDPRVAANPITPKTASDIGERMILVPQEINPFVIDEQVKQFVVEFSKVQNVVVIVPSNYRARFWADVVSKDMILNASNMQDGIARLRSTKGQLAVLVNKYDGIDLPDDACRVLVIDGLPDTRRAIERYDQGSLLKSPRFYSKQIQRIEQGMGRGIRSNEDYCVVLLMGTKLLKVLYAAGAVQHFSPATKRQLELSRGLAGQIASRGLDAMKEPIDDVFARKGPWVAAAKAALIGLTYSASTANDTVAVAQRKAFEAYRQGNYLVATRELRTVSNASTDKREQGWLLEQVAEVSYPMDKDGSQRTLAAASELNRRVLKPLAGIAYKRIDTLGVDQAREVKRFLQEEYPVLGNNLVIGMNEILGNLVFRADGADEFEQALMDLGQHLGFLAQRPEKDKVGKLDVLWAIGHRDYVLFPCKSEAVADTISKSYTDQVSGNMNWFREAYEFTCHPHPIIVHPSNILDADAAPPPSMRVMGKTELANLARSAQAFAVAVKDRIDEIDHVRASLAANSLLGTQFVQAFSVVSRRGK